MSKQMSQTGTPLKPNWIGISATYLAFLAVSARAISTPEMRPLLPSYLPWLFIFLILFTIVIWKYHLPTWLMHAYLFLQCLIPIVLVSIRPDFDQATLLYVLLSYQVSLYFSGRIRLTWIAGLILISAVSLTYFQGANRFLSTGLLIYFQGAIQGFAQSLSNIAAEIVIPAFIIINQETEAARMKGQAMVGELQETHLQLERYASQVEELASVQERIRLARELHDSVSQLIFSINLTTRSAQLLLKKDPSRLPEQLKRLQEMTTGALSQLRSLITQLRPPPSS